jgi:biliverdin reductase / flavin reductase
MKIAIFGATGNTGLQLVAQALQRGYTVTAIVRSPGKLATFVQGEQFKIVECDIFNSEKLSTCLVGHDCVLSALGHKGLVSKTSFYLDSMKSILKAMQKANVKRIVTMTSQFVKPNQANYPFVYTLLIRPVIGRVLDSMYEMEKYMFSEYNDESIIKFTIVRPPGIDDETIKDKKMLTNLNDCFFPGMSVSRTMPRANVAKFMLDEMENNQFIQKGVTIAFSN